MNVNSSFIPRRFSYYSIAHRMEAEQNRAFIRRMAYKRIEELLEAREGSGLERPKLKVTFFRVGNRPFGMYRSGNIRIDARLFYLMTDFEICEIIDHEVAHFLQHKRNRKSSFMRSALHLNQWGTFREGFAVFVESLDSRYVSGAVRRGLSDVLSGRKPEGRVRPYVHGYLRFLAVARTVSLVRALDLGFNEGVGTWLRESDEALRKVGLTLR